MNRSLKRKPCPLNGRYITKSLLYKAEIKYSDEFKFYVAFTENHLKSLFFHYQMALDKIKYSNSVARSDFLWKLKCENKKKITITWEYVRMRDI